MKRSIARTPKPGNPAAAVDVAAIERALAGLPVAAPAPRAPRPPRTDTQRHLIERLREPLLDAMVCRHQSPATLAELLGRWGIAIRPDTLRRYLGPIAKHPRRAATAPDQPAPDQPAPGEPSPARAGRETAPRARPGAGAVGSPEALARLESALAGMPSGPPPVPPAARPRPDDPPYCPPGTFVPRPELPIEEWYNSSGRTS